MEINFGSFAWNGGRRGGVDQEGFEASDGGRGDVARHGEPAADHGQGRTVHADAVVVREEEVGRRREMFARR